MIDEKYKLIEAGVHMSDLTKLDSGIETAVDQVLDDIDYEPKAYDELSNSLRDECYKHIIEFAEMDESNNALSSKFYDIKSDFDDAPSNNSKSAISVIIGSRYGKDVDSKDVKRDLVSISSQIMKQNYER